MKYQEHHIKVEKTAHYYTQGIAGNQTKYFWIIAHGYGQLASRIIKKFDVLDEGHFVLAPEGFSRFYWNNDNKTVAASWMTSKDRLYEIEDYTNHIQNLYVKYREQMSPDVQIIPFGFSQGVVTIWRWLFSKKPKFHHFILWAGWFAMDLDYQSIQDYLSDKKLHYVLGDKDQFYNEETRNKFYQLVEHNKLSFDYLYFNGEHEIKRETLIELSNRLF
jgi:predicted esterase